ncbi:hypothetical protein [Reinekea sp. G2M2-21]|uniref:hypothetical protein n=1 Tax=Reinekea sp. G2M2-21 TaxID=2788942 RepID=UPI0018A9D606|nr:hypothetical protein [Reinekea sp. G2M2-21]
MDKFVIENRAVYIDFPGKLPKPNTLKPPETIARSLVFQGCTAIYGHKTVRKPIQDKSIFYGYIGYK